MSDTPTNPDERRLSFNKIAKAYDRYRPSYPSALIQHIEQTARLGPQSRLLEIGCGPGNATILFAERGYEILCIEPGANLISVAVEKLRNYPVSFVNCLFEDWQEAGEDFDLVYSGQAFHWVPKDVGYAKAAEALKPGGYLALFWNRSPRREDALRLQIDAVYRRCTPELIEETSQTPRDIAKFEMEQASEIQDSGYFKDAVVLRFPWTQSYTTEEYLGLLSTHSDHSILPTERLDCLLEGVGEVIDRFGGGLVLHYLTVLYLARKPGS
jgi:SAM-dependent methyltransferase